MVQRTDLRMGTLVTQKLLGLHAAGVAVEVDRELQRLEDLFSVYRSASEVSRLNAVAGKGEVEISGECMALLREAVRWSEVTGGAFDVTIGPLVRLWQAGMKARAVPLPGSIASCRELVNYRGLVLDEERSSARLRHAGQLVDLGGIAKGYAGDRARKLYRAHQVGSAFINLGGNVVVLGGQSGGEPWRVGVQHPRRLSGHCLGVVLARDESVVTAGDYQRYYRRGWTRYHHIIDPRTGYPSRSGLISVTVVHELSVAADALSTATLVLGLDAGLELIRSTSGAEAVLITSGLAVYVTRGLEGRYQRAPGSPVERYI